MLRKQVGRFQDQQLEQLAVFVNPLVDTPFKGPNYPISRGRAEKTQQFRLDIHS